MLNPVEKVTEEFLDDELEWKTLKPVPNKKDKKNKHSKKRNNNLSPILEEKKEVNVNMNQT